MAPSNVVAFGHRIKELREIRKQTDPSFNLRGFAQMVGLSPTFISRLESGTGVLPKNENIEKMADALGADRDELFALASKVEPGVTEIIVETPAWADFLRTASSRGWDADQIQRIMEQQAKKGKDRA
ncbi:MAG: helix-turn-helix domain-containing protein [Armatimonadota bacterium]